MAIDEQGMPNLKRIVDNLCIPIPISSLGKIMEENQDPNKKLPSML